jgi:L-fuculose-phosphate aldolase
MTQDVKKNLIQFGKMLYDRKLTVGTAGNISAKLDPETMVITQSGTCKGLLTEESLVEVSIKDGKVLSKGRPSIETPFHLTFYQSRPDVNAVVHTHPIYCTSFACSGRKIMSDLTPEGLLVLGKEVPMVRYATPGTEDLAIALKDSMGTANAFLLEKHGAITLGKDMAEAFFRMETLEFMAELQYCIYNYSSERIVNKLRPLSKVEAERILKDK